MTTTARNLARAAARFDYARRLIAETRSESTALRAFRVRVARDAVREGRFIRANAATYAPSPNATFNY